MSPANKEISAIELSILEVLSALLPSSISTKQIAVGKIDRTACSPYLTSNQCTGSINVLPELSNPLLGSSNASPASAQSAHEGCHEGFPNRHGNPHAQNNTPGESSEVQITTDLVTVIEIPIGDIDITSSGSIIYKLEWILYSSLDS